MSDTEKLANLARNKRRAKRRGDPHFYQIAKDFKALKLKIEAKKHG